MRRDFADQTPTVGNQPHPPGSNPQSNKLISVMTI